MSVDTMAAPIGARAPNPIRSRLWRVASYLGIPIFAAGTVFLATRSESTPAAATAAHVHGAASTTGSAQKPVALSADAARRIGVTFATASVGSLSTEVRTVGQVAFDETRVRTISPKIDGWVERLYVNATGQAVSVGEPLLAIYSPMLVAAEEELLLAKRLQGDVVAGSTDAQRSTDDLLASARRRLEAWDVRASDVAEVERGGHALRTLVLRSSAGGYVLDKKVVAGQKIMAGDALYSVADLSTVWVEGEVFEQDLARVRVGLPVHADFQALPGEHRMGKISYVYPTLDPETRTAKVRVVLSNADLRLKPGMYATLRIVGATRSSVLFVPRGAVLSTGERSMVFVRDANGQLAPREVSVGVTSDERVEILRGLVAGETVVASATFLVDSESSLGKALGGMGGMPGMELTRPPKALPMQQASPPHAGHEPGS